MSDHNCPEISVVIPTRNRSGYLEECLSSLKNEIDETVQVYVIDDGSCYKEKKKNSGLCDKFGFNYHNSSKNRGMAVARNTGIKLSHSRWIAFLDDDVVVKNGWFDGCKEVVGDLHGDILGVEGEVEGSGEGLWDREVENLSGGLFITCHILYRRSILEMVGGFDEAFEYLGPFCEDQEIAVRILQHGKIIFSPRIQAVHLPRDIRLMALLKNSKKRIRGLLRAERYFYNKHPGRYRDFRSADTFGGTYRSVLLRHTVNAVRRRKIKNLLRKPFQTFTLLNSALLEQLWAWVLIAEIVTEKKVKKKDSCTQPDWSK